MSVLFFVLEELEVLDVNMAIKTPIIITIMIPQIHPLLLDEPLGFLLFPILLEPPLIFVTDPSSFTLYSEFVAIIIL